MRKTTHTFARLSGPNPGVFAEEPGRLQLSPKDRGRSFAQQKRFRMTDSDTVS